MLVKDMLAAFRSNRSFWGQAVHETIVWDDLSKLTNENGTLPKVLEIQKQQFLEIQIM